MNATINPHTVRVLTDDGECANFAAPWLTHIGSRVVASGKPGTVVGFVNYRGNRNPPIDRLLDEPGRFVERASQRWP